MRKVADYCLVAIWKVLSLSICFYILLFKFIYGVEMPVRVSAWLCCISILSYVVQKRMLKWFMNKYGISKETK